MERPAGAEPRGASPVVFTMEEGEGGSVRGATKEKADVDTQNDLPLLTDEKFDFDLSLSSSSANEDDEVFFGPVGHRERCVAAGLELQGLVPKEAEPPLTWSPLTGEKFVEIFKEARLLALQIASSGKKAVPRAHEPEPAPGSGEEFVQETRLKLDIFERGLQVQRSSPALKRETYCVLTPEVAPVRASLSFAESPGAPEPASSACLQSQGAAERKTASRLRPPKSSSVSGKRAPAKPQPGKQTHPLRLPAQGSKVSSEAVSSGTSEAGTSSISGSSATRGPPSLPGPSKFGVRKTLLKPPAPTRTLLGGKSNSFSGPGGNVNLTSSLSLVGTPVRGNANSGNPFPRLVNTPQPKPSGPLSHGNVSYPAALFAGRVNESASVSLRQPQTPRSGVHRLSSTPHLSQASHPTKPKGSGGPSSGAKAGLRHPAFSTGTSLDSMTPPDQGISRPLAGLSCGSAALRGTLARCSLGRALQPSATSAHTPLSIQHLSSLPTPSRHRVSALPAWPTPRTCLRAASPPRLGAAQSPAQVPPNKAKDRPEQAQERSRPGTSHPSDPPMGVLLALNFASSEQTTPSTPGQEAKQQPEAKPAPTEAVLIHLGPEARTTVSATPQPLRGQPLIDLSNSPEAALLWLPLTPAKAAASQGQLLIDLFHSPEVAKSVPSNPPPATGQLIDLNSPLLSLSPLQDKENLDSPLLKF
ncbi:G2 and S phase-expressed protein 1 isoform X2 [Notamacropus eugenii]|uniref:G2 and S phase-expressed protein 1 isoform X2 n=1 Tax=Notamacropus eugenii TaxID=9315 RepID=UPI003B66E85E